MRMRCLEWMCDKQYRVTYNIDLDRDVVTCKKPRTVELVRNVYDYPMNEFHE